MLLLDELRCRALQLACLNIFGAIYSDVLGQDGVERHADSLPEPVLAEFSQSLPPRAGPGELRESLARCVGIVLGHAAILDRRHAVDRCGPLAPLLEQHLGLPVRSASPMKYE
jgi:hypothetical protein